MKRIIIDNQTGIVRGALLEDGRLCELAFENKEKQSVVGNIYAAKVMNILPAQFAFLDIGEEKSAFLHLNDKKEANIGTLRKGGDIIVQAVKDATSAKGAGVTSELSFTGRLLVLLKNGMKNGNSNTDRAEIGVSQKIESSIERERLKGIVKELLPSSFNAIIRTEAAGCDEDLLAAEIKSLAGKLEKVINMGAYTRAPAVLHRESNLIFKAVLHLLTKDVEEIVINDKTQIEELSTELDILYESFSRRLISYDKEIPIFKEYGAESQLDKAMHNKVWLKSGGFIIIEQTEACVVIDVNSGKYISGKSHVNTATKTNLEAAEEIARQIRLRNLSGMIMIDFINVKNEEDKNALISALKKASQKDRNPIHISGYTELGVLLLTRKKTREPLHEILTKPCECCKGTGRVKI